MKSKKIKSTILILSILFVVNVSLVFTSRINTWAYASLLDNLNIVSATDNLLVHYISVGNGDAIAINLPDKKTILIDTGLSSYSRHYVKYIKQKVLPLDKDKTVDYLFLTHADADHIGSTVALLDEVKVKWAYTPIVDGTSQTYTNTMEKISSTAQYSKIEKDLKIEGENYILTVMGPLDDTDTNNSCPVIRLDCFKHSYLFVGDIEAEAEEKFLLEYYDKLDCDVLKVAHHGSDSSSTDEFIRQVSPSVSIISVGKNNRYGHPKAEVIDRLQMYQSNIYRTDTDGDIMILGGNYYDLDVKTNGDYTIIDMPFDYRLVVFVMDGIFGTALVIILVKKEKNFKIK